MRGRRALWGPVGGICFSGLGSSTAPPARSPFLLPTWWLRPVWLTQARPAPGAQARASPPISQGFGLCACGRLGLTSSASFHSHTQGPVLWASGLGPAAATGRAAHRVPAPQQVPRTARGPEPCVCCFLSTASRMEARSHCTCRQLSRQSFSFIRGLCPLHPKEGLCGLSFACPLPASLLLLFGAVTKNKPGDSNA